MTGTAAIYTRISKDREGRELGVQRQEADCRALANRLGYDSVLVFQDNDVSASTLSDKPRPEFVRMMEVARKGEVSAIIAYSNSRLTRRVAEIQAIIDVTKKTGIRVHTVASGQHDLDTADGRAAMLTIAVWDQAEAERTSERIKRQKQQRAAEGEWHGGIAPFGYTSANKVLTVNPAEVALIEEAATRVLAGDSLHSIVTGWNKRGTLTRFGKHWRQTNLRSILMNPTMLGQTKTGDVAKWPAVIDRRTFDRLQRVFNDPARKVTHSPGVKSAKYSMGGGVTVCALCGHKLISGGHHKKPALKCTKVVNGPTACGHVVVDHDRLERHVFEHVMASLAKSDRLTSRLSERPDDDAKITALEAERDGIREQQRALHDMRLEGTLDPDYHRAKVADLQASLDAAQAKIDDLLGRPLLSEAMKGGLDWEAWSPDKRRNFLKVARIRVEVGRWPEDVPRNFFKRSSETVEEFHARQDALYAEAIAKRTTITAA